MLACYCSITRYHPSVLQQTHVLRVPARTRVGTAKTTLKTKKGVGAFALRTRRPRNATSEGPRQLGGDRGYWIHGALDLMATAILFPCAVWQVPNSDSTARLFPAVGIPVLGSLNQNAYLHLFNQYIDIQLYIYIQRHCFSVHS